LTVLPERFYAGTTLRIARSLVGKNLIRNFGDGAVSVLRIVETEAYHQQGDEASHSFRGETERNRAMFGPAGRLYVYLIYGVHLCMNITTEREGVGAAVLLRAAEVVKGQERLLANRHMEKPVKNWLNGPGKLGQALAVDRSWNGHPMSQPPLQLAAGCLHKGEHIQVTTRIGISKSVELPWRFILKRAESPV
jgi:DNA-3-methyladenine glycosylase